LIFADLLGFLQIFAPAGMTIRKARRQERAKAPDSQFHAPPKMTMYIFASPATLTGAEEKKTGPSRFNEDFWKKFLDANFANWVQYHAGKKRLKSLVFACLPFQSF
jgi:hypothetical protein